MDRRSRKSKGKGGRNARRAFGGIDRLPGPDDRGRADKKEPKDGAPEDTAAKDLWPEVAALLRKLVEPWSGPDQVRRDYLEFLMRAEVDREGAESVGVDFSALDEARRLGEPLPQIKSAAVSQPGRRIRMRRPPTAKAP
jgi:hypothetical protein